MNYYYNVNLRNAQSEFIPTCLAGAPVMAITLFVPCVIPRKLVTTSAARWPVL